MNSPSTPEPEPLSPAEEQRLQQLFHDEVPGYIDDAGFSMQVLGRLPPTRVGRERRRLWLVGGAVLFGGAAAVVCGGHDLPEALLEGWRLVAAWSVRPIPRLEAVATVGTFVVLVGSLVVAWWSRREA